MILNSGVKYNDYIMNRIVYYHFFEYNYASSFAFKALLYSSVFSEHQDCRLRSE